MSKANAQLRHLLRQGYVDQEGFDEQATRGYVETSTKSPRQ